MKRNSNKNARTNCKVHLHSLTAVLHCRWNRQEQTSIYIYIYIYIYVYIYNIYSVYTHILLGSFAQGHRARLFVAILAAALTVAIGVVVTVFVAV